jgi:hypothetical protein
MGGQMIMKNILKYSLFTIAISYIYLFGENVFSALLVMQELPEQSFLLFEYGILIGFIVFVVFIVLLQLRNYYHLMYYKPVLGRVFLLSYQFVAIGFSLFSFINYSFQKTIILALTFLLVTAVFDQIRDKILSIQQGNIIHPKKIL